MRLIHCADIHLDSVFRANFTPDIARIRREEILQTFLRMVQYARTHAVEAVLIAGDLFDREAVSVSTWNTVTAAVEENPSISFFVLEGNHDRSGIREAGREMPENWNIFCEGDCWTRYDCGRVSIYGSNTYGQKAGFRSVPDMDPEQINLVMAHGQVSEYPSNSPSRPVVCLADFQDRPVDYLALGHLHRYQWGYLPAGGRWCYPGCLEGRGYDECGPHGFVLLEIDESLHKVNSAFVPFACRNIVEREVNISGSENSYQILRQIQRSLGETDKEMPGEDDMVKIVLTGVCDVEAEKNLSLVEAELRNNYFHVRIEDRSKFSVSGYRFAADVSLKGEFMRQVLSDPNLTEIEKSKIVRCGMQALAGEEISL